jgi:hypothetical protein
MEVEVNIWGVLAASVVSMVVGGIWYSKGVFGKTWAALEKIDEKKAKDGAMKALAGMLVLSLVMAYVLAHITYLSNFFYADNSFTTSGVMTALWVWVGFVLPTTASNSLFNQKPWKLSAIHAGNWLVTLVGMGLVIGLIGV